MLKVPYKFFIFTILMAYSTVLFSQQDVADYQRQLQIEEALYPPEDILSASSLVLFSVSKDIEKSEWKNKLTELQVFFASQGIDAVAYMDAATLYNRLGVANGIPQVLSNRQIKNLILFHYQGEDNALFLAIGPFSDDVNFWAPGDTFWMRTNLGLAPIFQELDTYFKTGARLRTNLLINDHPEFFESKLENDRNILTTPPNIRLGYKVALKNWDTDFYRSFGAHFFMEEYLKNPKGYLDKWSDRFSLMESVAADTTNNISFVDPRMTTPELRRDKYDYELDALFGNHQQLNRFFKSDEPLPYFEGERVVFYLKSLGANTIYLPKDWEPVASWSQGLNHLLDAFKSKLYPQKEE